MLTRRIKVQVAHFVLAALLGTSYLGSTYVGIDPFSDDYRVTVSLPEAGGAFDNGEVTYRGVPVGRVESLRADVDGAEAVLRIDGDAPALPADVTASVANRSAIGEQYVDLRGSWDGARTSLGDGDRLTVGREGLPPPVSQVLRSGRDLVASVPQDALTTVVDETYELSRGLGDGLGVLVDASQDLVETADENFLVTSSLIDSAERVLTTQRDAGASIRSFSADLAVIADTLESSDGDLRRLVEVSPAAAREVDALFTQVGRPLGLLLGNLVSTAQVLGINAAGVEDALVTAPEAISVGWTVVGSRGVDLGLATNFFDPLPCVVGYGGTQLREGVDTSPGRPFNTSAGCRADPASGTNVRGPQAVPRAGDGGPGDLPAAASARVRTADSLADLLGGGR